MKSPHDANSGVCKGLPTPVLAWGGGAATLPRATPAEVREALDAGPSLLGTCWYP